MAKRVLIVDDHAPTRAVIRGMLQLDKTETWEVVEAGNGAESIRAVASAPQPFDIILLDVNMPDMDGFGVCRAIREIDGTVPIVFITAEKDFASFNEGRKAGGDSYLVKPVSRAALKSAVDMFTSMSRAKVRRPEQS